jgi:hypothetical protein
MQVSEQNIFDETDSFLSPKHLILRGTNFEIGQTLAEMALEKHGLTAAPLPASRDHVKARRAYFQRSYPIHWERMRGVAAAFGLDPEDDRYDLSSLWGSLEVEIPAMGCSVAYYPPWTTAGGHGYLSRNLDFPLDVTIADVMRLPLSAEVRMQMPSIFNDPYIMEWYPEDGGYASLAIHAFDTLTGTVDGMNSAGLVISQMMDEEAIAELGPNLEPHPGLPLAVGLSELHVLRFVLDTCATADEAKVALLTCKQYYGFAPLHYIVADKAGNSFIYENSTGRNVQHIIDGDGQPQVVTNFQIYKHPNVGQMPKEALTWENNAFWRYQMLEERISQQKALFMKDDIKANHAYVNFMKLIEKMRSEPGYEGNPADDQVRTLWHSLYDQQAGTAEFSFYLGEKEHADGTRTEYRSDYLRFELDA